LKLLLWINAVMFAFELGAGWIFSSRAEASPER